MARVPAEELERLKREVSVVALAEARGVTLKPHGADLIGLCPFHADREHSLVVTPSKNLWHCLGACQAGGSVIDWVMKAEGVSFRHAVELLRSETPTRVSSSDVGKPAAERLPADADDAALLLRVVTYYHETLKQSPEALRYLASRGLQSSEMIEHFQLGFANRTLAYRIPEQEGKPTRERLQRLGILRASGHEHLSGALLHQHQRPVRTKVLAGERVEYVEATLADVALANRLAAVALGRTLDELPPQTRRLLLLTDEMVAEACRREAIDRADYRFSRRQIREHSGYNQTQLRVHLERLVDMEYLLVHRGSRGQGFVYELLYDGQGKDGRPFLLGLLDVEKLDHTRSRPRYDDNLAGANADLTGQEAELAAPKRPQNGPVAGGWRVGSNAALAPQTPDFEPEAPKHAYRAPKVGPGNDTRSRTDEGGPELSVLGCQNRAAP